MGSFVTGGSNYTWIAGNAYAFQDRFYHEHGGPAAPGVDWLNPVGQGVIVDITGSVQFDWEQGAPNAVDYVVVKQNFITNAKTLLYQTTVSPSGVRSRSISLPSVTLSANEGLLFTYRAQAGSQGLYTQYDSINVGLVQVLPEPASLSLCSLVSAAVLRRSRRRDRV
jgi:hypothetical protein